MNKHRLLFLPLLVMLLLLSACQESVPASVTADEVFSLYSEEPFYPSPLPAPREAAGPTSSLPPPETEPPIDYVILPSPVGKSEEEALALLPASLTVKQEHTFFPLPKGLVCELLFEGKSEDGLCYIDPAHEVTLVVSEGIENKNVQLEEENKVIYLTFDDGPHVTNTAALLDILAEYGVKATFFTVGSRIKRAPELLVRMKEEGHAIGCHSFSHVYDSIYESSEALIGDIALWEDEMVKTLGDLPITRLFRYPGGSTKRDPALKEAVAAYGYRGFDWNIVNDDCMIHTRPEGMSAIDFMKNSFHSTFSYSLRLKRSPHILLMHDTYQQTVELLPYMLDYMLEEGCSFETLDKLDTGWYH